MTPPDQAGANQSQPAQREKAGPFVPSFISANDLARGDGLFFGAGRALRRCLGALAVLAVLTLITSFAAAAFGVSVAPAIAIGAAAAASGFGALWFLGCLFRRHPARVCYVRPSARPGARRFISELRPYGHVIAYRTVENAARHAASARAVASRLRNRFALNLRGLCSDHQTLTLSAAPELTHLLTRASDVLVVDLSNGAPADWGIIGMQTARCVFVSAWGQHEQAEASFASLGVPGQCFFYAPDGEIQRRGQFRAAMLAAMRAAHAT